ncbi:MAG TPA: nicotinamidase [Candidatus Binataceae bacterium]|nr:nicotinamidase [Candidatus Binataceae bacterium]
MKRKPTIAGRPHEALLVVDIQPDFLPGGALPVAGADAILSPIRRLMESGRFERMVAVQDWHPPDHVSFASNHPGRKPLDSIVLHGHEQTLWPDHCVQGTSGAELHSALPWNRAGAIIRKAMDPATDSYSAFRNNWDRGGKRPPTGLSGYLKNLGVKHVFICGLARDYCVNWSAEDAIEEGFRVTIVWDLTRSINPKEDRKLRSELSARGVRIASTAEVHG